MSGYPNIAILFWCYKDLAVCRDRMAIIRRMEPELEVHVLFGGDAADEAEFARELAPFARSFYRSRLTDPVYKWRHGEMMIDEWYREEGAKHDWDSIFIYQWDLLVLGSIASLFPGLSRGQCFFSALVKINSRLKLRWRWASLAQYLRAVALRQPADALPYLHSTWPEYRAFREAMSKLGFDGDMYACLFIVAILSRDFMESFTKLDNRETGFLEYKLPTYAKHFGLPIYEKSFGLSIRSFRYATNLDAPLNADNRPIDRSFITDQLARPDGFRMFHPFREAWLQSETADRSS